MTATPVTEAPGRLAPATALLDLGSRACAAYGLPYLGARLAASRLALAAPLRVVVVGDFKRGKSSLVNALLGATVCPVDDNVATALPTYVRHGPAPSAELIFDGDPPRREPIRIDEMGRFVLEQHNLSSAGTAGAVEVRLPHELLADGLVVVDAPGVGGLGSARAAGSLAAISMADAVLFVTDAEQALTRNELDFLRHARTLCGAVVCVLTKIDFYPGWRAVRQADEDNLAGQGIGVIAVSSPLRRMAIATADADLDAESGFDSLVAFIRGPAREAAEAPLAAEAASAVATACDQILAQFEAERAALADPAQVPLVTAGLAAARRRVEGLRAADARWSRALDEGAAELAAGLDHELRTRVDRVVAEADAAIDEGDPADTWPQMTSWLQSRLSPALVENYVALCGRADKLCEAVEAHYREAAHAAEGGSGPASARNRGRATAALRRADGDAPSFGVLGGLDDIALSPISVGITLVMGYAGLRDEKERQLDDRRAQAKEALRRYCDDVIRLVGGAAREVLRRIEGVLRERLTAAADDLHRSYSMALDAVAAAATRGGGDRAARIADLDAELASVRDLRRRAAEVAG